MLGNMLTIFSFLILFISTAFSQRNDHLSMGYAKFIHENPGGSENFTEAEKQDYRLLAFALSDAGVEYHKIKDEKEAVEKYGEALSYYGDSLIYYRYGESLSALSRLETAIKAYKIALFLHFEKKDLVYYRIAIIYSRLKKENLAYEYLELALINGYSDLANLNNDHDLDFLRSSVNWKKWFDEWGDIVTETEITNFKGYEDSGIRGLCVTEDYIIIGNHEAHTVYIYGKKGALINQIENNSRYFGHGVASDNQHVWTSDYMTNQKIYEYEIHSGKLVNEWIFPYGWPVRMDYDENSKTLFITAYDIPKVFHFSTDGQFIDSFAIEKGGVNPSISLAGNMIFIVFSQANPESDSMLYMYSKNGNLIEKRKFVGGHWAFDIWKDTLYYDTKDGIIKNKEY